ncbi:hypothetical protein SEA_JEMERALD_28 [Microbacterium phage Jemerald]|nr:hypothetical protein SEA_JUICER_28 [Microbacterium phage Juicer]WNO27267.1 hypothetical protein SEA_JEMERALD_28 [Microbacterium phage Jemerald]
MKSRPLFVPRPKPKFEQVSFPCMDGYNITLSVCVECGALVGNQAQHLAWHKR